VTVQPVPLASLPAEVDRVWFEADRLLKFINESAVALDQDDTLPSSQYLDITEAVHDCPCVAVTIGNLSLGLPGAPASGIGELAIHTMDPAWTVILTADIVRCAAQPSGGGTVSPKSKLTDQVKQASRDAAVLVRATNQRRGDFWGYLLGGVQFLPPQGTSYSTRLNVQVALH
jgi:hypothetical protein